MFDFINTVDVLGDEELINIFFARTITEYNNNHIKYIRTGAFAFCTSLTSARLPLVTQIDMRSFESCISLKRLYFRDITNIGIYGLYKCSALEALVLAGTENICTLSIYALNNSSIADGTGYIYVPQALLESYKTASGWSNYADQFRALEDYTVDGTITGELDESKI